MYFFLCLVEETIFHIDGLSTFTCERSKTELHTSTIDSCKCDVLSPHFTVIFEFNWLNLCVWLFSFVSVRFACIALSVFYAACLISSTSIDHNFKIILHSAMIRTSNVKLFLRSNFTWTKKQKKCTPLKNTWKKCV